MEDFAVIVAGFKRTDLPESEVEFVGEVPHEALATYRKEALETLAQGVELPGFRKGHVPHDMVEKRIGEIGLLEESAELFMRDFYPELVRANTLDAIGRPVISITKLAPGNPVGFTIRTAVFPKFSLPDYKKIASKVTLSKEEPSVSEEDMKHAIDDIRRRFAPTIETPAEAHIEKKEPVLPELTDEFVKKLGPFENVAQFTERLKTELLEQKRQAVKEQRRATIIESILEKTEIAIPTIFVESELDKAVAQMKEDVKRFQMTFEDYLKRTNKTEGDIRNDFREGARKRAKLQLTLNAIAEKEEIKIPAEDIKKEAEHVLEQHASADRERVHIYVESVMKNEKVLQFLEAQA